MWVKQRWSEGFREIACWSDWFWSQCLPLNHIHDFGVFSNLQSTIGSGFIIAYSFATAMELHGLEPRRLHNDAEKLCTQHQPNNTYFRSSISFQSCIVSVFLIDCNIDTYQRVHKFPAMKCVACTDAKATMMYWSYDDLYDCSPHTWSLQSPLLTEFSYHVFRSALNYVFCLIETCFYCAVSI